MTEGSYRKHVEQIELRAVNSSIIKGINSIDQVYNKTIENDMGMRTNIIKLAMHGQYL